MNFTYSYQAKVPSIRQVKAPWWLRWWKKTLPEASLEWRRFYFSCEYADTETAVKTLTPFLPFALVSCVQLEENRGITHENLYTYISTEADQVLGK